MDWWFERLFFIILPDFLPQIAVCAAIVYVMIGKPKMLTNISRKIDQENGTSYILLTVLVLMYFILFSAVLFGVINILLVILNMIPGIAM